MAVLLTPVVLLKSALAPVAVLLLPVVLLNERMQCRMAVLREPVVLLTERVKPMAVLSLPVVRLKRASSPRTVFWFVKQPSWQTARACGESAKQPSVSAMRTGRIVAFLD